MNNCLSQLYLGEDLAHNVDPVPPAGTCFHRVRCQRNIVHKVTEEVSTLHGDNLTWRPHNAFEDKPFSGLDADLQ